MRRVLIVIGVVVLVLAGGGYAVAQARGGGPAYRTAVASRASLERTLDLSGTVGASGRRDLSFGTAGTVSTLTVHTGQRVRAGQVLGRLDPTALDAAVTSAVATLAKARAQLADDEDAQATAVTSSSSSGTARSTPKATQGTATKVSTQPTRHSQQSSVASPALAELRKQQQAVTQAQSKASAAIAAAKAALAAQLQACAAQPSPSPTPSQTPSPTSSPGTSATPDPTDGASASADPATSDQSSSGSDGLSQECTDALAAVQQAQTTVQSEQDDLQRAIGALASTVTRASHTSGTPSQASGQASNQASGQASNQASASPSTTTGGTTSSTPAPTSSSTSSRSSYGGGGGAVTAATLARDQASIDTATAGLREARASRALATLRAPYAGRVVEVSARKGDAVGAADAVLVLIGRGVTTVTGSASSTQVTSLKAGQRVQVTPAGGATLSGTLTRIDPLPDSSGDYPITVTIQSTRSLAEGTTASLAVVVGAARDAVTVPTSAVTRLGSRAVVSVLADGRVRQSVVSVGVVGARRTSLTSGLSAGAKVVVADLGAALPTTTSSGTRRGLGGGGLGGAGLGGGPPGGFQRGG